jgi:hypothetical protein
MGGSLKYLSKNQANAAAAGLKKTQLKNIGEPSLTPESSRPAAEYFIQHIPAYPDVYAGRGIVICAGGTRYFTTAWVCIKMLRHLGCRLPIEVWYLGEKEMNRRMRDLLLPLGVRCVNAQKMRQTKPARILNGWEIKPYSMLHSSFQEVLFLDADNVPIVDPTFLFETPEFRQTGAIFWPDYGKLAADRGIWKLCGVSYRDEPEFESGQIVVDKQKSWSALCLTMWYNEHSDFFYHYIHGDKETFHIAFRKLNAPYVMPSRPIQSLEGTMCQHDFQGRRIFQHRNLQKWDLKGENKRITGFEYEEDCLKFLAELNSQWDGTIQPGAPALNPMGQIS